MKINFSAMTDEERTSAFADMDNDALTAALTEQRDEATTLFAIKEPSIAEVDTAEALVASVKAIEGEQATRAAAVKDAADRFSAARESFGVNDGVESSEDADADEDDEDAEDADEADADEADADEAEDADSEEADADADAVTTASGVDHTKSQRVKPSAARRVGRKAKRPAVASTPQVTITAAADVQGFATGQSLDGMEQVTKALLNRVKGFSPFNAQSARSVASQSGGQPVLNKFGVASFGIPFDATVTASKSSDDYSVVRAAIKARMGGGAEDALTAAGWCAPSENVYSYIADYVVDGLLTLPEVNAPRGGINITTGPARSSQDTALTDFGFVQTEAQAEASTVKTCETIVCPDFEDYRLDAIGYCYKIPLLTQKAYPELITDALRFANVLYAHKVNARLINDLNALAVDAGFAGYGPSFTDALEAMCIVAVKERRKWNLGRRAVIEVTLPEWVEEVFRADISRRNGVAKDSVSDGDIARHFTDRNLSVEYVADFEELDGPNAVLPGEFPALMKPSGAVVKAVEDVVNLSAVYDAASLSVNEYTGVFFEQGILVAPAGYGVTRLTIPVNTAGEQGALTLNGLGDSVANGSF
jgi:hypothetical protein